MLVCCGRYRPGIAEEVLGALEPRQPAALLLSLVDHGDVDRLDGLDGRPEPPAGRDRPASPGSDRVSAGAFRRTGRFDLLVVSFFGFGIQR
jgi:hypothetical protein